MDEENGKETAKEVAREYAEKECVGQFGEVIEVEQENSYWVIEFRTHTYSDEYRHEVRINQVGNVFSHERNSRFD